jgi:prepilin-type N-terminal cleavage/methylation domain-containing protein
MINRGKRRTFVRAAEHTQDQKTGFTVVEILVGITILGILMMGFLSVFPLGMRTMQKSEMLSCASGLAQDELERLKVLSVAHADLAAGNHAHPGNPLRGVYTLSWTVVDDSPLAQMKTIDVAVNYSDQGVPRTVQFRTYLAP